ncbi:hypothetical protein BA895_07185 [Humibacillus sp. DSM 29435]|uniref:DUF4229 domain-containing protein n=1 Tax=Humibacillus sp. DSM 29435 TaxID=1869167 RepID=UPI000871F8E2|nr:DUF4229 domain-containing protein [Humibacillus sp. DSM 29435]OFE14933.1 hypothetical protein BA895_07185 [Humibacillus sp. DSM 29435]
MVRYTVLRLLIFFGFVLLFWLVGLRDTSDMGRLVLVGSAAVASAAVSYVLLRGMRDEMTAKLVERHEARLRAKAEGFDDGDDELAEDAEIERDR